MSLHVFNLSSGVPFQRASHGRRVVNRLALLLAYAPRAFFSRATQIAVDVVLCGAALLVAYLIRFDFAVPTAQWHDMLAWLGIVPVLRVGVLQMLGTYRRIWRYFNLDDALVVTAANVVPSAILIVIHVSLVAKVASVMPLSVIVCEFGVFTCFSLSIRLLRRVTFIVPYRSNVEYARVILVGSDVFLAAAAQRLRCCSEIEVVGLLVVDSNLQGLSIAGFPVIGSVDMLPAVLSRNIVDRVLVADAGEMSIAKTVAICTDYGVDVKLIPDPTTIVRSDMRFVKLPQQKAVLRSDINGDESANPAVVEAFLNRIVLVTGAGGSIGSELTRQVARLPVSKLVLLDRDENALFELKHELNRVNPGLRTVAVVGDIRDRTQLRRLFVKNDPAVVLHAAAYKHVPVMEENCCEAVLNNVLGTRALAEVADEFHAERFLMISTDKAVHPSSVMGATKRVAELFVQKLFRNSISTRCACVRFGNVLGSRGSVVPIFLKQIADGGPITVTDAVMTRYFMTIPEAVRLVLQASTLGSRGDIYMLDMGDPVKITTLAERLIVAAGLRPGIDIKIQFTGSRRGEKLHEQLWAANATVRPTQFEKVFKILSEPPCEEFDKYVSELVEMAAAREESSVLSVLSSMPIGFKAPQEGNRIAVA